MQPVSPFPNRKDAAAEALRVPPHSLEAEQAVLGGLMLTMPPGIRWPTGWTRAIFIGPTTG